MSIDATRFVWKLGKNIVTPSEKLVLLSLADRADEFGYAYPSQKRLSADTTLNIKTIKVAIHNLTEKGILRHTGKCKGSTNRIPIYQIMGVPRREDEVFNEPKSGLVKKCNEPYLGLGNGPTLGLLNLSVETNKEEKEKNKTKKEKEVFPEPVNAYQDTYYPMPINNSPEQNLEPVQDAQYANDTFEVFWNTYPIKKDRRTARNLWMQMGCYMRAGMIIEKLMEQVQHDVKFLTGFIPNPTNYLRGARWEDEIERARGKADIDHKDTSWIHEKGLFS